MTSFTYVSLLLYAYLIPMIINIVKNKTDQNIYIYIVEHKSFIITKNISLSLDCKNKLITH